MSLTLDHIGLITPDIAALANVLTALSGFGDAGPVVDDPIHQAKIQFLSAAESGQPRLELVEPTGAESILANSLGSGGGVHHLCFQVASVDEVAEWCKQTSVRKVFGPNPAPAFGDDVRVVFAHAPGLGLVEFVDWEGAPSILEFSGASASPLIRSFIDKRRQATAAGAK